MENEKVKSTHLKRLRVYSLSTLLFIPLLSFSQNDKLKSVTDLKNEGSRIEVNYKQRHSRTSVKDNLYADGIKIKKDLSLIDEVQEERLIDADEIPADDLYGNVWNNRYINVYKSVDNIPDSYEVDLSNFTMPTMGYTTSNFGKRRRRMHYGIDLKVEVGDTIYAAFDGKVRIREYEGRGYGYYVTLRHYNGLETVYGHLSRFLVRENQVVKSGDPIALGGNTGRSTGPHLHFEVRFLGRPINPTEIIDFDNKVCHRDKYTVNTRSFNYYGSSSQLASARSSSKSEGTNKYVSGKVAYHRVKNGDSLYIIAKKHGITVRKLCTLNSINERTVLKLGRSLRVS